LSIKVDDPNVYKNLYGSRYIHEPIAQPGLERRSYMSEIQLNLIVSSLEESRRS